MRTLRKILDDLNLQIASIRFPTRHGFDHLENLDRRIEATKSAMRAAYRLGAPLVVNQIGPVPAPPAPKSTGGAAGDPNGSILTGGLPPAGLTLSEAQAWATGSAPQVSSGPEIVDPRWNTLREVLDDLGRFGARVGSFFAAETGTEPGEHLARLIDMSSEAYIAVALNPGQLIINRHSVPDAVAALKDRIRIVNAVDGVLDLSAGRGIAVPVGQGTADFPSLIGQLEDIPYRGPFVVGRSDMPPETAPQEIVQSIEYLRNL
ncbi:Xylose isomerase domain protein TIM barrel [Rhodopirellula sp. SWK7]|nr:Xylose isomerase domain protein TIM barrel [Rhodopirellula sp. SWK7]